MKTKRLRATFLVFDEPVRCCICGDEIYECYLLEPIENDDFQLFEEKFGDISNWVVGECCFGGYCGAGYSNPDDWYERFIEKKSKED